MDFPQDPALHNVSKGGLARQDICYQDIAKVTVAKGGLVYKLSLP